MRCCPNCFDDRRLKDQVSVTAADRRRCEVCGSSSVRFAEGSEIAALFNQLLLQYARQDVQGKALFDLVQDDWGLFTQRAAARNAERFFYETINLQRNDLGEALISPVDLYELGEEPSIEFWEEFVAAVKEGSSDFEPNWPETIKKDLWRAEARIGTGTDIFRARKGYSESGEDRSPFADFQIGAPPPECTRAGRANFENQPVFYGAEDEATAIYEVRPPRNHIVSIGRFHLRRKARILDLTNKIEVDPFEESAGFYLRFSNLLFVLRMEMAWPMERDDDADDYLPLQKLVQKVREARFDGIRYASALNPDGRNVVLFDPSLAIFRESWLARVDDVSIEYRRIPEPSSGSQE